MRLRLIRFASLLLLVSSVGCFSSSDAGRNILVWDNVLGSQIRQDLHQLAAEVGLGHRVFRRSQTSNLIERTLDAVLKEIGDGEEFVEYWSRQEWRHIEAHADVDENLAKEWDRTGDSGYRYPKKGHVLYLQVGSDVRGPTCVFDCSTGGDLAGREQVNVATVPAVEGRLLRFEGSLLHAVPRPTDLWFLSYVKGSPDFEPKEVWGRSVILFNTWSHPPTDLSMNDANCPDDQSGNDMLCNKMDEWQQQMIENFSENGEGNATARVWLLGNQRRRHHLYRTVKLSAPGALRSMLHEKTRPGTLSLRKI